MKAFRWFLLLGGIAWLTGCQESVQRSDSLLIEEALPYITEAEFKAALAEQTRPILVEFCVPVGCARCDEMRPLVNQLAEDHSDDIEVVRVNLNYERALTERMGVRVCPTYIAFDQGQEVFRKAYPTTTDLIASELHRVRSNNSRAENSN